MIRPIFPISLILVSYFLSLGTSNCFGLDEGGCLTCHQYPGLVRLEKDKHFKPLHIEEGKFFSSPHGKFRCERFLTPAKPQPTAPLNVIRKMPPRSPLTP